MKKAICVLFCILPICCFGQIDIQAGIGNIGEAPYHIQPDKGINIYQVKAFYEVAPTWKVGLGAEDLIGGGYQFYPIFAELNRDFNISRRLNIIGGAFLGVVTAPGYSSGLFGFDLGLVFNINEHIGIKAELGGMYMSDLLIFPCTAGIVFIYKLFNLFFLLHISCMPTLQRFDGKQYTQ